MVKRTHPSSPPRSARTLRGDDAEHFALHQAHRRRVLASEEGAAEIAGSWVTAWEDATSSQTSSTSAQTIRNVIPASVLQAGIQLRFTFRGDTDIGRAFVGLQAPSGDTYDFAAAPTQMFFNEGSPSMSLEGTVDGVSDPVEFVQDGTDPLVVSIEKVSGSHLQNFDLPGGEAWNLAGGDDGDTVDTTGYAQSSTDRSRILWKVEIFVPD